MWRILFLILILFSSIAFAQAQEKPQAVKFDEFGKLSEQKWKARLEKYRQQINCSAEPSFFIIHFSTKKYEEDNIPKK